MVTFNDNPILVSTVDEHMSDDDNSAFSEEKSVGSERSVSDYVGGGDDLPELVWFGPKECRCIFSLESDKGTFQRVCGNKEGECNRPGHAVMPKAGMGYYEPVKARKFTDGKLETLITKEDYLKQGAVLHEENLKGRKEAGKHLGTPEKKKERGELDEDQNLKVPAGPSKVISTTSNPVSSGQSFTGNVKQENPGKAAPWNSTDPQMNQTMLEVMRSLSLSMANLNDQMIRMGADQKESNNLLAEAILDQQKLGASVAKLSTPKKEPSDDERYAKT